MSNFNPLNQNFTLIGKDGITAYNINLTSIIEQRIRIANYCISYGVQLGLVLFAFITFILLNPGYRMKKPLHIVNTIALLVSAIRLIGFVMIFPGRLVGYYTLWTHDLSFVPESDFTLNKIAQACGVIQFALIEASLMLQVYAMATTWKRKWVVAATSGAIILAVSTIVVKTVWIVHFSYEIRRRTLPIPLDSWGEAGTLLGAVSIFYFCGLFFVHLATHLRITNGLIRRNGGWKLNSLEILAVGNGMLMILPAIFASIDIVTDLGSQRILPFDAGSWVETLVTIGLPLTSLVAVHRGEGSRMVSRRLSLFVNNRFNDDPERAPVRLDSTSIHDPQIGNFANGSGDTRTNRVSIEPTFLSGNHLLNNGHPSRPTPSRQNTYTKRIEGDHYRSQGTSDDNIEKL